MLGIQPRPRRTVGGVYAVVVSPAAPGGVVTVGLELEGYRASS